MQPRLNPIFLRFLPVLVVALASCQAFLPENKTQKSNEVSAFLDTLKANGLPRGLEKTVRSEGQTNTVTLPKPDLDKEFAFFSKAILTDTYLKGYYMAEVRADLGNTTTIYRANSPKPEVRLLAVVRNGKNRIIGLHVETLQDNYLYEDSLSVTVFAEHVENRYRLNDYKVVGTQKMLFGRPYEFDIYAKAL